MHRNVFLVGALLVVLGLALFAVKTFEYGIPVAPTENLGPWQVELRISARGDGARGSVRALLPSTEGGQVIFDERSSSDRLQFSIRERGGNRIGVWSGWLEDVHEVVYEFRVQSHAVTTPLPDAGAVPGAAEGAPQRLGAAVARHSVGRAAGRRSCSRACACRRPPISRRASARSTRS